MQIIDLDQIDRRILAILQTEAGVTATEVGERIGLSQSACWRRIQRLRDAGVIKDQPAVLDREKVGLSTRVFAHVKLTSHGRTNITDFADAVRQYPEVLDCYVVLGNVDFLLRIVTEDIKDYERFMYEKLSQLPGVQEVNSSIALSEMKHTTVLPIRHTGSMEFTSIIVAMALAGAAGGLIAGLLGVGGGIIIVPVLEFVLGLLGVDSAIRMHVAVGTSLATNIPPSFASARAHHKAGAISMDLIRFW